MKRLSLFSSIPQKQSSEKKKSIKKYWTKFVTANTFSHVCTLNENLKWTISFWRNSEVNNNFKHNLTFIYLMGLKVFFCFCFCLENNKNFSFYFENNQILLFWSVENGSAVERWLHIVMDHSGKEGNLWVFNHRFIWPKTRFL